jgi:hypothetical protein
MAGKNPEHPNPDGDVEHAVIVLVLFTFNDFFHEWLRVSDCILICKTWNHKGHKGTRMK